MIKEDTMMGQNLSFFILFLLWTFGVQNSQCRRLDVEEVTKRQLDSLLKTEDYLAVFWCKFWKNASRKVKNSFRPFFCISESFLYLLKEPGLHFLHILITEHSGVF